MQLQLILLIALTLSTCLGQKDIGSFVNTRYNVKGEVVIIDDDTLEIRNFNYDGKSTQHYYSRQQHHCDDLYLGKGPDAFFYMGNKGSSIKEAGNVGILIPFPADQKKPEALGEHNDAKVTLEMPKGYKTSNIGWLSVWCRKYSVDFGHVNFPNDATGTIDTDSNNIKEAPLLPHHDSNSSGSLLGLNFIYLLLISWI